VDEVNRITTFLKDTFEKTGKTTAVVAVSGGIDSATSLFLLKEVLPIESIHVITLPARGNSVPGPVRRMLQGAGVPDKNIHTYSIEGITNLFNKKLNNPPKERLGNVMARLRMIFIYDLAKKLDALVVGTENRSEMYLGYFTRFGDEASDIEPIQHLFKSEVKTIAKELGVPREIIDATPTAGLWEGQTDESQLGFTYEEADKVLKLVYNDNLDWRDIQVLKYESAEKIAEVVKANHFKHEVPYKL
jgi:NAD+ synthase